MNVGANRILHMQDYSKYAITERQCPSCSKRGIGLNCGSPSLARPRATSLTRTSLVTNKPRTVVSTIDFGGPAGSPREARQAIPLAREETPRRTGRRLAIHSEVRTR